MSASGRLLLLFSLAWAALWSAPACFAGQECPAVRLAPPHQERAQAPVGSLRAGLSPAWTHREACESATEPLSDSPGQQPARGWNAVPAAGRTALARAGTAPPYASDILLLIQRQNE